MYHPYNVQNAPDLLAVEEGKCDYEHITGKDRGDYRGVHYNRVVSVIECKPKRGNGWAQASTYYWQLMEARPDMPGVYGLSAKPQGYQVLWSDACGTVISPITEWNKLDLLEGYVYSLYFPPKGHFLFDPTITSSTGDSDMKQPMWTIKSPRGVEYSRCLKLFTGSSWGRRTSIWRQQGQALVIKDSFREDVRRFEESKFLQDIHDSGIFPGVVRTLELPKLDPKSTAIATALRVDRVARKRTRLILGSYGEPLENARSVKDILMAVYDILEGMYTSSTHIEGSWITVLAFSASRLSHGSAHTSP